MGIEIIAGLIATLLGALMPLVKNLIERYLKSNLAEKKDGKLQQIIIKVFDIEINETKTYKQRLTETLDTLKNAFTEVDKATIEFTELMKEKERSIELIESRLTDLSNEEATLKERVETLQKVPIEAVPYLEEMLNKGEKRSAYRDYLLFVFGIIVSVVITLVLKFYFGI